MIPTNYDDDVCIEANTPATLCFTVNGWQCFVIPKDAACPERAKVDGIVTHRIESLEQFGCGIVACKLVGTDGSTVRMYFTHEDIRHNISLASEHTKTLYSESIC